MSSEISTIGTLDITVHSGRGLAPKDANGQSDPYYFIGALVAFNIQGLLEMTTLGLQKKNPRL